MIKPRNLSLLLFSVFTILVAPRIAQGQTDTFRKDSVYSTILKESRPLRIYVPKNYKSDSTQRLDVLYVLDGEWNTSLASTLYGFLEYGKFIPTNLLVVGIPNIYQKDDNFRDRDFTPTRTGYSPRSGGAADFLAFLKTELLPYINQKYPTRKDNNTLYGTSLGGLFGVYAFLHEPGLFKSYLNVEPSLWWDHRALIKTAAEKLQQMKNVDNTFYIASRDGRDYQQMGVDGLDSVLRLHAPAGLRWKVDPLPNETHFTSIWKGIFDGMKFSYTGHLVEGSVQVVPMNGIVMKGQPFKLSCYNVSPENSLRYTIDGTEPGESSAKMAFEQTISFSQPGTVKVKSTSARKDYASELQGEFKVADAKPASPKPKGIKPGGLRYAFYQGDWDQMPDLKKIKPAKSGIVGKDFNFKKTQNSLSGVWLVEGFLEIPEAGYYVFQMVHDHVKAFIGNQLVIGRFEEGRWESFIMPLQKGFYPIRLEYILKKDAQAQWIYWRPQGKEDGEIPFDLMYGKTP